MARLPNENKMPTRAAMDKKSKFYVCALTHADGSSLLSPCIMTSMRYILLSPFIVCVHNMNVVIIHKIFRKYSDCMHLDVNIHVRDCIFARCITKIN